MRKTHLLFLFVAVVEIACSSGPRNAEDRMAVAIDSLIAATPDFSGVVLVADQGVPVYHQAFGYANFDTNEPLDTGYVFELASVSKQFTAMTIMMLQQEGKLRYDDPVDQYIPGLPYPGITIRHLLTHTSGLPDYQAVMDQHWDKTKVAGNQECIEYLIRYAPPKLFEPGAKYNYSNTGYLLLASIAEKASGIDFIAFARTRLFVPLQMTSTDIRSQNEKAMLRNMAWGHLWVDSLKRYQRADSMVAFNYGIWLGNRKGPGRISSTSTDLLKWDQALYDENFVKKETLLEAFLPMTLTSDSVSNYGFGWELQSHPKLGRVVRHSGSNPGYNTHIVRYIDVNKTIIMLCNNAHRDFKIILKKIEALQ